MVRREWKGRTALLLGFGTVLALLVFAAFQAWWMQRALWKESTAIEARSVERIEALYAVRRVLYMSAIRVRDYLLDPSPNRVPAFRLHIGMMRAELQQAIERYEAIGEESQTWVEGRRQIQDLWERLERLPEIEVGLGAKERQRFLEQELARRRQAASAILRALSTANAEDLRKGREEFLRTQGAATLRLSVILGLCVLCGIAVAWRSLAYSSRLEQLSEARFRDLALAHGRLEQLSARLLEIQEEERKRLSRELHDEIGQTLTALRIEISEAERGGGLARARALIEDVLRSVRNVALLLRPSMLDDLGLVPALQWQIEQFTRRTGIPVDFREEGVPEPLPDALNTCLYRIAQEALHNVERHAAASRVRVEIRGGDGMITMAVQDDGRGFVPGEPAEGARLGLVGVKERVAGQHGIFALDSAPGRGARLEVRLPLDRGNGE